MRPLIVHSFYLSGLLFWICEQFAEAAMRSLRKPVYLATDQSSCTIIEFEFSGRLTPVRPNGCLILAG
jgi:hypothetical protein